METLGRDISGEGRGWVTVGGTVDTDADVDGAGGDAWVTVGEGTVGVDGLGAIVGGVTSRLLRLRGTVGERTCGVTVGWVTVTSGEGVGTMRGTVGDGVFLPLALVATLAAVACTMGVL